MSITVVHLDLPLLNPSTHLDQVQTTSKDYTFLNGTSDLSPRSTLNNSPLDLHNDVILVDPKKNRRISYGLDTKQRHYKVIPLEKYGKRVDPLPPVLNHEEDLLDFTTLSSRPKSKRLVTPNHISPPIIVSHTLEICRVPGTLLNTILRDYRV